MQVELKRLRERLGITFIFVTHDQQEALVMSDRIAVINHGRLEQVARRKRHMKRRARHLSPNSWVSRTFFKCVALRIPPAALASKPPTGWFYGRRTRWNCQPVSLPLGSKIGSHAIDRRMPPAWQRGALTFYAARLSRPSLKAAAGAGQFRPPAATGWWCAKLWPPTLFPLDARPQAPKCTCRGNRTEAWTPPEWESSDREIG